MRRKVQSSDWSAWQEGECSEQTFLGCFCFMIASRVVSGPTWVFWVGPLTGLHYDRGQKWPLKSTCVLLGVNGQSIPDRMYVFSPSTRIPEIAYIELRSLLSSDLQGLAALTKMKINFIIQIYVIFRTFRPNELTAQCESYLQLNSEEISRSSRSGRVQFLHLGLSFYQSHFLEIPAHTARLEIILHYWLWMDFFFFANNDG